MHKSEGTVALPSGCQR